MPMYQEKVTLADAKGKLSYNSETGKFIWIVKPARNVIIGDEAGCMKATRINKHGDSAFYKYVRINKIDVPAAQLAWLMHYGEWAPAKIYYIDGDQSNLAISNLRLSNYIDGEFDMKDRNQRSAYMKAHREKHPDFWKNSYLNKSFGISLAEYTQMAIAQENRCAICKCEETQKRDGKIRALSVDHNHTTGAVRALLCSDCNTAIGKFKENTEYLKNAISYLECYSSLENNVLE